jgi:hypothetical protein
MKRCLDCAKLLCIVVHICVYKVLISSRHFLLFVFDARFSFFAIILLGSETETKTGLLLAFDLFC